MCVLVGVLLVAGMDVPMLAVGVRLVGMLMAACGMVVEMLVLMVVFVHVLVFMGMGVDLVAVGVGMFVLMVMRVLVVVGVGMLAFHVGLLCP